MLVSKEAVAHVRDGLSCRAHDSRVPRDGRAVAPGERELPDVRDGGFAKARGIPRLFQPRVDAASERRLERARVRDAMRGPADRKQ